MKTVSMNIVGGKNRFPVSLISLLLLATLLLAACSGGGSSTGNASGTGTGTTGAISDDASAMRAVADFAQAEEDAYVNLVLTFSDDGTKPIFDSTTTLSKPSAGAKTVGTEIKLLDQMSVQGVSNNPPVKSTFTLTGSAHITKMLTYHYNGGSGDTPGTLSLMDTVSGTVYGPWTAIGNSTGVDATPGATWPTTSSGPPYLYWIVQPNADVPAGTYELVDSNNSTWAYTSDTGSKGLSVVYGWMLSSTTGTGTGTGTGTVTSTNTTSPGASAAYLRMYELQRKVLDKYDLFDAAMTYLDSQAAAKPGMPAVHGKNGGKNIRAITKSGFNLAKGFQQSGSHRTTDILDTLAKLDSAGKQEAYNVALDRFHTTGTGDPGANPAAFIQNLTDGKLDTQAPLIYNDLVTNPEGKSNAFSDASPANAIAKAVVKEGMLNISNGIDVIRDTLALVSPPIGQGMDKAGKFINAVNNPDATIEKALTDMIAAKLGVDSEVLSRVPDLMREIKYQTFLFKKRSAAIAETEALQTDGKVVVSGGQSGGCTISALDKNTNKLIVGAGADTKLLPPGTYKVFITCNNARTVVMNNVVVTQGQTTTLTMPSTSTGTGTGTGTGTSGGGGSTSDTKGWGQFHLTYTITGATFAAPPAYSAPFGYDVWNYSGTMDGTVLTISGNGSVEQPSAAADDFNYTISASVSVGANSQSYNYTAPVGEILNKPFNLSVPIPAGATTGSFSMRVDYHNSLYDNRGVVVTGTVTK